MSGNEGVSIYLQLHQIFYSQHITMVIPTPIIKHTGPRNNTLMLWVMNNNTHISKLDQPLYFEERETPIQYELNLTNFLPLYIALQNTECNTQIHVTWKKIHSMMVLNT